MRLLFLLFIVGCGTPQITVAVISPPLYDIKKISSFGIVAMVGYGEQHLAQTRYIATKVAAALSRSGIYTRVKMSQLTEPAETPISQDIIKNLCNRLKVTHIVLIRVAYFDVHTRLDIGPYPQFSNYRWYLSGIMRTSVVVYNKEGKLVFSPRTVEVTSALTSPSIPDEHGAVLDLCNQTILQIQSFFCPSLRYAKRRLMEAPAPAIARAIDAVVCGAPLTAVNYLRFAVKDDPNSLPAHYNLAVCSELLGTVYLNEEKTEEALAAYKEALQHYRIAAKISRHNLFSYEIKQVSTSVKTLSFVVSRAGTAPPPKKSISPLHQKTSSKKHQDKRKVPLRKTAPQKKPPTKSRTVR